jgi:signal transduction histidine kinase
LETIYSHALRLNVFVNDMLMLAKMRAGELILNRSMVDIEVLVDLVKQSHLVMARLKRIDIAVHWPVLDAKVIFQAPGWGCRLPTNWSSVIPAR